MAKVGGFYLKGLAGSLQGMPQRIYEVSWRAKQEKKLKAKEDELSEMISLYTKTADKLYEDNWYSKEDISKLNTIILAGGSEFQSVIKDTHSHISELSESQVKQDFELIDSAIQMLEKIDLKNIDEAFEEVRGFIKSEDALNRLNAYENLLKRQIEVEKPTAEVFPTAEAVQRAYPDAGYKYDSTAKGYVPVFKEAKDIAFSEKKFNWRIEQYNLGRITFDNLLKGEGMYIAPEKATGLEKQVKDIRTEGERAGIDPAKTNKAIQDKILGVSEAKPPVEGEITAGEKRAFDMASSVMFGSSDWVTGISKPGIISQNISNKLNMGQKLTEEEIAEVRNNYNTIKGTLPSEIKSVIESQLKRYGISLEAPVTPEPITPVEPTPGILQRGIDKVKSVISGGPDIKPIWGLEGQPKGEIPKEVPPMKVPTGEKEAMIPLMSEKELEDAIKGLDPSDPMYKFIYDEAVKRGYITK